MRNNGIETLKRRNYIDYKPSEFIKGFREYSKRVSKYTNKNKKHLHNTPYCYYTGIKFSDDEEVETNPNDYRKRTIDHKVSVWIGFVGKIPPEVIGGTENLVYCLRYCNGIKGNMDVKQFEKIAKFIREGFIAEGYESD